MTTALPTVVSKINRVRGLVVRAGLTLSALQATFWFALVAVSLGPVLLLCRRLMRSAPRVGADAASVVQPTDSSAEAGRALNGREAPEIAVN